MEQENFNIMAFPAGSQCNLACDYCYYSNEEYLYSDKKDYFMSEEILEAYISQYVQALPGPAINFGWQGGEPSMRGLDFFKTAVSLEKNYLPQNWQFENSFQTNGTLIDEQWARFLHQENFLVGISIDGPRELHNKFRKDRQGSPTFDKVMRGLNFLQEFSVPYNILCVVSSANARHPEKVYNFYKELGAEHIQFIPLVEKNNQGELTSRSVKPRAYGEFLREVFHQWILQKDIGNVFVQIFEQCVAAWSGYQPSLCIFRETCGRAAVMEFNGDLYTCDHFVYPDYRLGNIKETPIAQLMSSEKMKTFGQNKRDKLGDTCRECEFYFICHGGCPKNRNSHLFDNNQEENLNYLCAGYKLFYDYINPFMQEASRLIKNRKSPSVIQKNLKKIYDKKWKNTGRNDPCPCGSGKKYKKCCLSRR
ncbi:MAG: anaerobic sulfatase maturase [Halanaerobiaceae bacterium]